MDIYQKLKYILKSLVWSIVEFNPKDKIWSMTKDCVRVVLVDVSKRKMKEVKIQINKTILKVSKKLLKIRI